MEVLKRADRKLWKLMWNEEFVAELGRVPEATSLHSREMIFELVRDKSGKLGMVQKPGELD